MSCTQIFNLLIALYRYTACGSSQTLEIDVIVRGGVIAMGEGEEAAELPVDHRHVEAKSSSPRRRATLGVLIPHSSSDDGASSSISPMGAAAVVEVDSSSMRMTPLPPSAPRQPLQHSPSSVVPPSAQQALSWWSRSSAAIALPCQQPPMFIGTQIMYPHLLIPTSSFIRNNTH